jgi:protein-tyrosine phosphatase
MPTNPLQPPFVPIAGVRNFRDFGGYRVGEGKGLPTGFLYRSGAFADMDEDGRSALADLGIKVVVDLRRSEERAANPSQFAGDPPLVIASKLGDRDGTTLAPHLQFIKAGDLSVDACHAHMVSAYQRIPWEPQHHETYRATFEILGKCDGPLIIHCAAGKDRTGILCGLIHHVLGVSADDIMADYLLSNHVPLDTDWLETYARRLTTFFDIKVDPEALLPMLGVHPDYLNEAWTQMRVQHGGIEGYLDTIGVDARLREQVATAILG